MLSDPHHTASITIRYGKKRYLLCADEVTNFLANCDALGLPTPQAISDQLILISDMVLDSTSASDEQIKLSMKLLREISLATSAALFSDPVLA